MKKTKEEGKYKKFDYYTLGGDIGGTNTKLGIFGIKNESPALLNYFHYKSSELKNISDAVNEAVNYAKINYKTKVENSCLAVAGPVSAKRDFAKLTNEEWAVSSKEIKNKTGLNPIIINDFEAVGFGINVLRKKDFKVIKKGQQVKKAPIALIGAGTGLGKSILIYDKHMQAYIPISSEGGHADFPALNEGEANLLKFVKKFRGLNGNISYEHLLSGHGIESIYYFLRKSEKYNKTEYSETIDNSNSKPELISKYKNEDDACRETFGLFAGFYARAARNFALESLARGGVYIGGGIAMKNEGIFGKNFIAEFENNIKLKKILKNIPVYLIKNYYAGLFGAGFAALRKMEKLKFYT